VVAFTEGDKKSLEALGVNTPIYHIPFGTTLPDHPLSPAGCPPLSLVFVGSFIHPPNVEAANRLARLIFPRVQNHFPELELYIVGDQPPHNLKKYSSDKIHITGWVPEVAPYLDRAAVFAAPIFSGGGMRVKILEALAAGKAVVATPLAIEGLQLSDGEQVSLARDDEEMAERIIQLLANPDQRTALARRARLWACDHLGWSASIEAFEALWQELFTNG
jgi:glycosyltransferase involved in cell wall biosynthesis